MSLLTVKDLSVKFPTEDDYYSFLYEDFVMQIFGHAPSTEMDSFVSLNELIEISKNTLNYTCRGLYFYSYYAKTAEELPYWDKFPLSIAVGPAQGGFYGLNLHYLHPTYRARLMDRLLDTVNNDKFDETTKMRLNYSLLTSVARLKYFKPCFKHYLYTQLESRIMLVPSSEWEIAMYLPTEKFTGANKKEVWRQSKKMITG